MDKSGVIVSGALGSTLVLILVAFVLMPPPSMVPPSPQLPVTPPSEPLPEPSTPVSDLIVSNGHDLRIVGEVSVTPTKTTLPLTQIFEKSETGVVQVNVNKPTQLTGNAGVGSGFVYDKNGFIITNAHVIDDARKISVTFLDGTSYNAELIGADLFTDIAVIKVVVDESLLHPLVIGDSSQLKVGEPIAAIGNPFGLSGSMTSGIVSQLGRLLPSQDTGFQIPDVIQTDAAINPGNSGGPLLNMRAEVIGINTAIQSTTGEFTGIGFAVPSKTILKIVPTLIKEGEYHHPWMGISGRNVDADLAKILNLPSSRGFLIVTVVEESPASKTGLHGSTQTEEFDGIEYPVGGDVIQAVDGNPVRKIDDILTYLQRNKSVGDEIVLEVLRDGRTASFVLKLEERPILN